MKFNFTNYDINITIEISEDSNIDDAIHSIYTGLLGLTYPEEVIINGFKDFIKNNG